MGTASTFRLLLDDDLSIGDNPSIPTIERIGDVLAPPPAAPTAARPDA